MTKKKAAKNAQSYWGKQAVGGVLAQAPKPKPFAQALKEFDAAAEKIRDVRAELRTSDAEVTAFRASWLVTLCHEASAAAHYLEQAARAEAIK